MNYKIPILFNIFNRPDVTLKVFEEIKKIKPDSLYISADGPRDKVGEKELCEKTRSIVNNIDWNCKVKYNFSEKNLGCHLRMETAISWFFKSEEMGIILEDDCLPNSSFFKFTEDLLLKYKDNVKIMMISGDNFQDGKIYGDYSYYFSHYPNIWGWATWKRVWDKFDKNLLDLDSFINKNGIKILNNKEQEKYWLKFFLGLKKNKYNNWDAKFVYTVLNDEGLCIVPNKNLVTNIGFGKDATHTKEIKKDLIIDRYNIDNLIYNDILLPEYKADKYLFDKLYKVSFFDKLKYKIRIFIEKIKK
ncbi:MAG: nucleotide-diphospho-sugar transferase [Candidatus Nomurabacteria bacterium]